MEIGTIQRGDSNSDQESPWLEEFARQAQDALLASVSHELRTPLTSITGCLSTLLEDEIDLDKALNAGLITNAYQEAERLNRMIGNLLEMARITSGTLRVNKREEYIQEVIGFALKQFDDVLKDRSVTIEAPATIPLIPLDFVLMVKALSNVIENAIEYSAEGSSIRIQILCAGVEMKIQVMDNGVGIAEADLPFIFDRFYHPRGSGTGLGLGLAVAGGILEAHGGSVRVENRSEGGVIATLALPVDGPKI